MSWLRSLFEVVLDPLDRLLMWLPLETARVAALALLAIPAVLCLLTTKRWILRGAPDDALWRDLRLWAVAFSLPYLLVYWLA